MTEHDIPSCLIGQVEEGSMLGSCDWGDCSREQAGWALGQGPHPDSDPEWLAICHGCAHGDMRDPEKHPIQRYVSLDDVLEVMDV